MLNMKRHLQCVLVSMVLLMLAADACAVFLPPTDDSFVNSAAANNTKNYGNNPNLKVGGNDTSFVSFDFTALPPGTLASDLKKASILLFTNSVTTSGAISIVANISPWSEGTVTFVTAPSSGATIATIPVTQVGQFVVVDVTAQVKAWITSPWTNFGVSIRPATSAPSTNVVFDSKEGGGNSPILDITLSVVGPQGPVGATGPIGPTGLQGPVGPAGAVGAVGATGPIGPAGIVGATGPVGPAGAVGTQGPFGPVGVAGAAGPTGPSGPVGSTGPQGPVGPTGAAGVDGSNGQGFSFQGAWSATTTYFFNDIVAFNGSSFVATGTNAGVPPNSSPTQWALIASKGDTGAAGVVGPVGPQGLAGVAGPTGTTGNQGPAGPIGAMGPAGNQGPAGVAGVQGPAGAVGATGPAGPVGATGLPGPIGPAGPTGDVGATGPQGPAGTPASLDPQIQATLANLNSDIAALKVSVAALQARVGGGTLLAFNDNFDGSSVQSTYWSTLSYQVAVATVNGGFLNTPCGASLTTENKLTFRGSKIVLESRFAGPGANRDTVMVLVDKTTQDRIQVGDTTYWGGMYIAGSGAFNIYPASNGNSTSAFKEYRLTLNGTSLLFERGDTLANVTETMTRTLGDSIAGHEFYLLMGVGGPVHCPGVFDWVRLNVTP